MSPLPLAINRFMAYSAEVWRHPDSLSETVARITSMLESIAARGPRAQQSTSRTPLSSKKARAFFSMRARSRRIKSIVGSGNILAGAGIHFHFFAFFDKNRHLDLGAS